MDPSHVTSLQPQSQIQFAQLASLARHINDHTRLILATLANTTTHLVMVLVLMAWKLDVLEDF